MRPRPAPKLQDKTGLFRPYCQVLKSSAKEIYFNIEKSISNMTDTTISNFIR
jgi:hypothetical protein